jgi:hypothetical protein
MNVANKTEILLQDGLTALPQYVIGTPIEIGDVSRWNQSQGLKSARAFDIEVKAAAAVSITAAELFGINAEAVTFSPKTISAVTAGSDTITVTGHALLTGYGPVRVVSSASDVPAGLDADTDYWVVNVTANTISLATSLVNAFAEVVIDITDAGSGTLTLVVSEVQTYRARLMSYGLLGPAFDGVIECTDYIGWTTRITHRPRTVAYFVVATLGGAVATTTTVHVIAED